MSDPWTFWANLSQIATGVLAFGTIGVYRWGIRAKRRKLEKYLEQEKLRGGDKGQRTTLHLMAHLGLTQEELLRASFASKLIKRTLSSDESGKATHILFEFDSSKS